MQFLNYFKNNQSPNDKKTRNNNVDVVDSNVKMAYYDEAFKKAGFGLWQWMMLFQCGWANATDAIEIMCISFILSSIKDKMDVSYAELSSLTFSLFLGMMIGGYVWGSVADIHGRRSTICISLFVNFAFGAFSSLSRSYWIFLILRFLSGFGVGGSLPACFAYFSEFQPTKYRGAMISALAMCWILGNLVVGLLAYLVLPESDTTAAFSPFGEQWRLFVIICSLPSLTSVLLFYFLPESPRFLFLNNRPKEALDVLKKMFDWNHIRQKNISFDIDKLHTHDQVNVGDTDERSRLVLTRDTSCPDSQSYTREKNNPVKEFFLIVKRGFSAWKSHVTQIFAPNRRTYSVVLVVVSIIVAFCSYGMAMWAPVLLDKTERFGGSPCRGHTENGTEYGIKNNGQPAEMYVDILIGFSTQLLGSICPIFLMDRIGSKIMLVACSFLSGVNVLFFWAVNSKGAVIAMNAVYNAISLVNWVALDVILIEIYPTNIRSAATGMSSGVSRIGSIVGTAIFGIFMDLDCSVPILAVFTMYVICCAISFKLPNTRNISLV